MSNRNYAQPVSRDGFSYDGGTFFVEIEHHRHPRLDSATLYSLLTYVEPGPLLTKAGTVAKRQPQPHKDSPGHFYQAQCSHYGLQQFKQRPAAKKHLLAAFDATSKTLGVPAHILALEQALKEEYKKANVVAEQKAREERERREKVLEEERKQKGDESDALLKEFAAVGVVIGTTAATETESDDERTGTNSKKFSDTQLRKTLDLAALLEAQLRTIVEQLVFNKKAKTAIVKEMDAANHARAAKAQGKNNGQTTISPFKHATNIEGTDSLFLFARSN